jgi:two-component sensor histidine kinase
MLETDVPLVPQNEAGRIAAVRRYDILDTPPDGAFDRITAIAARLFDVPISIVSIVDHDRIWFKSHYGLDVEQIDRGPGLCASAILSDDPRILRDARLDLHAMTNPLVAGEFGLRFYVGVPLHTYDGFNLGTLCVIDQEPREVTTEQIEHLKDLASVVMDQLELRRSARSALGVKEALIQEINHRVSNSLQLVSSLLTLQARNEDPALAAHFASAVGRVTAIGRVHRRLYQSDRVSTVEFKQFLEQLGEEMSASISADQYSHTLSVASDPADIRTDRATVLGLIVNELVTNALKYAYPGGAGPIAVSFRVRDGRYELSVSDQGRGLPEGFDPLSSTGLGMRLVRSLVGQIGGELSFDRGPQKRGTRATVRFSDREKP